tara:strand:+ start:764 stop:1150 length:387 start_codon:yes stop_codon:yes gene_type:complete
MNIANWYKRAFVITKGDPLYKDYVHDVYIKIQRKEEPFNDSYIYLAIHNRWLDERRRLKESTISIVPVLVEHKPVDFKDYNLDEFETEVSISLNEGYRPKEIAKICGVEVRYVWRVIRSIKTKIKMEC